MPNFVKLIHKHRGQDLHPGEEILGAVFVQPTGSFGRSVAFGVAGAIGGAVADARRKEEAAAEEDSLATRIPGGRVVLAFSAQRFLVFEHGAMSGRPKELIAEFSWDQIAGIELSDGKLKQDLTVGFSDESSAVFEVVKSARPKPFMEAYRELRG